MTYIYISNLDNPFYSFVLCCISLVHVMYCIVLCCILLYCILLYCIVLIYCSGVECAVLYCMYCTMLFVMCGVVRPFTSSKILYQLPKRTGEHAQVENRLKKFTYFQVYSRNSELKMHQIYDADVT